MRKHLLYFDGMNIGGRIEERLKKLKWERKDLLNAVPDLTPQALSNLITRDSKRSEWDTIIADALGVSVLWLVYGIKDGLANKVTEASLPYNALSKDEELLVRAFRSASADGKGAALMWAKTIAPTDKDLKKLSGT